MTNYTILSAESGPTGMRYIVYIDRPGQRTERAKHLGRKGYFATLAEAQAAVSNITRFGTTNV